MITTITSILIHRLLNNFASPASKISEAVKNMMYHLFADDFQIYKSFKHEESVKSIAEINKDLRTIEHWAADNKLKLNVAKTQAIAISANNETRFLPPLWLNRLIVPYSDKVKNLGMIFSEKMDWREHVELICDKVYKSLRSAWSRFSITPQSYVGKVAIYTSHRILQCDLFIWHGRGFKTQGMEIATFCRFSVPKYMFK